jgi:hypothetical protein
MKEVYFSKTASECDDAFELAALKAEKKMLEDGVTVPENGFTEQQYIENVIKLTKLIETHYERKCIIKMTTLNNRE